MTQKKHLKKLAIIFMLIAMTFLLSGCEILELYALYGYAYGIPGMEFIFEAIETIQTVSTITGLLLLLAGFLIYEWLVQLVGFFTGGLIGAVIGAGVTEGEVMGEILGFFIGGGIGAGLALLLFYLGVFITGAFFGATFFSSVWVSMTDSFPPEGGMVVFGLIGGILLIAVYKFWLMALTSAMGAIQFGAGIGLDPPLWIVLFLVGLGVQTGLMRSMGKEQESKIRERKISEPDLGDSPPELDQVEQVVDLGYSGEVESGIALEKPPVQEEAAAQEEFLPPPPPPKAQAFLLKSDDTYIPIRDKAVLGRSSQSDIQIADKAVSRKHALIRYGQGSWFIQDQESKGGTFVNGKRQKAVKLKDGDRIKIGGETFTFKL